MHSVCRMLRTWQEQELTVDGVGGCSLPMVIAMVKAEHDEEAAWPGIGEHADRVGVRH